MSSNFGFGLETFILIIISCCSCHKAQLPANMHSDSLPSISAVLLECPKEMKHKTNPEQHSQLSNTCEPQIMINIRVNPTFNIKKVETFLILDEVYHPQKRLKAKIMAPYLIEISRGEPVMMYPLEFTKTVQVGNGVGEPQIPNKLEQKNCHLNSSNNQRDNHEKTDDNATIQTQNTSISLHQMTTSSDDSPKEQPFSKVMQNLNEIFPPINKINDNPTIGSRKESHTTEAHFGHDVLGNTIKIKTGIVSDNFAGDNQKRRIPGYKTQKYIPAPIRTDITANAGVGGNLTGQLQSQHDLGRLGIMKMFHRNGTLPKNRAIKEFSNYHVPVSNRETLANNYATGFADKNIKNTLINENSLESKLNANNRYDAKMLRHYQHLASSAVDKPALHMTDGSAMFVDKYLNMGRGPATKRQFVHSYGGNSKRSKLNFKCGDDDPASGVNDQQRQIYFPNISAAFWQQMPYQNSVYDLMSSKTNKNHEKVNRAMDEDDESYYALKGEFQNRMSKNLNSGLSRSYKKLSKHFNSDPIFSEVSNIKYIPKTDQYRYDFSIVEPLNEGSNDNSLTYLAGNPQSPYMPLDSLQERNKQKRSYLFYDDMEMTGNSDNNEDIYEHLLPVQAFASKGEVNINDGVQLCNTCGGKGKKPLGKGDTEVPTSDNKINNCNCRSKRIKCSCVPNKITQSVGEARLNSLSGIFANANLSILFSSHVDIFQLEKSLRLQNHQLFIPKDDRPTRQDRHQSNNDIGIDKHKSNRDVEHFENLNLNPEKILAINGTKPKLITNFIESHGDLLNSKINNILQSSARNPRIMRNIKGNSEQASVRKIAELGYFPTTMNMLERCPNNVNRLCLNMLDDIVPAFTIKVKMPFRENTIVFPNVFKVKITKVISDTTTKDALQISVDLINEGIESHEFSVSVNNCPTASATAAKTSVLKFLLPHVGETINFLLPFIVQTNNLKPNKFHCEVVVKTIISSGFHSDRQKRTKRNSSHIETTQNKEIVVAVRQLTIEPGNRCLCVWKCRCHCVSKLETYVDFNICQKLDTNEQYRAGLLPVDNSDENLKSGENNFVQTDSESKQLVHYKGGFLWNALLMFILMIFIGLFKAIFGICVAPVDKFGYDYLQPGRTYDDSSKIRHFWVNAFFFIIFPFIFWCKCFTPSAEDLLVASTEWSCQNSSTVALRQDHNTHKYLCSDEEDEDIIFTQEQHIQHQPRTNKMQRQLNDKCTSNYRKNYQTFHDTDEDDEHIIFSINSKHKSSKSGSRLEGGENIQNSIYDLYDFELALNDDIFDDDEEMNTKFILKALAESRESLKQLQINNQSISLESISEESNSIKTTAEEFVKKLTAAQIVYRTFDKPIGNLRNIPSCFKYCIQGYFLPSVGVGYEFVNYNPLAQHRCVSMDGKTIQILRPPNLLCPKDFSRRYANKYEVLKVGDLTEHPPEYVPCINISALAAVATSMAKLASDQNSKHEATSTQNKVDVHDSTSCVAMNNKVLETQIYRTHSFPFNELGDTYLIDTIEPLDDDMLQSDETVNTSNNE